MAIKGASLLLNLAALPFALSQTASGSLSSSNTAQPTSTYSQSNVPTGTPVPGNYAGPLRPQVHFSPPAGFINDPNGMFLDAEGIYHLRSSRNQHWGHATSQDLYHWTNQPIAIFPGASVKGIFSGSAVVDSNNTSGFFPNQTNGVVAIYTLNTPERQTQDIAYSYDGGYSFIKYAENPAIPSDSNQFRDPKVIWHEPTSNWVMVVAYATAFKIGILTSPDLISWTPTSNFTFHGLLGLQYECPNLVEMPLVTSSSNDSTIWLLWISINPGAPLGGSITEYFPGSFNGTHFTAIDGAARLTDFAKDNYAGQFFSGLDAKSNQIAINWASNWQYTNVVPTTSEGFRSFMTVPRSYYVKDLERVGYSLISYPHNISAVVESEIAYNSLLGNGTVFVDYSGVESGALYFEANITGLTDSSSLQGTLNFTIGSSGSGESVSGGTFISSGDVWLDRGKTGWTNNPFFSDKFSQSGLYDGNGTWRLSGIVDRSIIEVFLNGGELSATSVFFPSQPLDWMTISVKGMNESATASVGVWALAAAWESMADVNGTVVGNVTHTGGGQNATGMKYL